MTQNILANLESGFSTLFKSTKKEECIVLKAEFNQLETSLIHACEKLKANGMKITCVPIIGEARVNFQYEGKDYQRTYKEQSALSHKQLKHFIQWLNIVNDRIELTGVIK